MTQNKEISSIESSIKNGNCKLYFQHILICKCGHYHEFYITFEKEHIINFPCISLKLSELNESKDVSLKCKDCNDEILINRDYCKKKKTKTVFICENCSQKKKRINMDFVKISSIFTKKDDDDNFNKEMEDKLTNFINKNEKLMVNEFYQKNLNSIELLGKFIIYLCFLRKLYAPKNEVNKVIFNFLEYFNHLIDVASKNKQIYDIYHFNKETIIYSYLNNDNEKFLSNEFKPLYTNLLFKCKNKRFLSLEMLKYIHEKYSEKKLVDNSKTTYMKLKYLKKEKIDVGREVFIKASDVSKAFLNIKSILIELNQELQSIKLKTKLIKLEDDSNLEKYLNSFLNIPSQFSIFRKSVSIILNKIIKQNYQKLNFNKPNEKIINLTLDLINRIIKQLSPKINNSDLAPSIIEKLNDLIKKLDGYKNAAMKKKDNENYEETLKCPLITLNSKEKQFLVENFDDNLYEGNYKKITVSKGEDQFLDFIINYLFEIKDITSKTIHINNIEDLKFFSYSKDIERIPKFDKEDDLDNAIKKIKNILDLNTKKEEVNYSQLMDFLFDVDKKRFFTMDNKIDYLLSFLNIKLKNLSNVKDKYQNIKDNLNQFQNEFAQSMKFINFQKDEIKYNKFINKYQIKINSKEIFDYLDNIVNYIILNDKDNKKKIISEDYEYNKDKKSVFIDIYQKYEDKEKDLRKNVIELFEKDPKFITYLSNYFWTKLSKYIEANKMNLTNELNSLRDKILEKNLLCLKLKQIKNIISTLKLYNFDIKTHFKEFSENYIEELPQKKKKERENATSERGIKNFNTFISKLKEYIGDLNEKVKITEKEPGEYILQLFLEKIGLNWS